MSMIGVCPPDSMIRRKDGENADGPSRDLVVSGGRHPIRNGEHHLRAGAGPAVHVQGAAGFGGARGHVPDAHAAPLFLQVESGAVVPDHQVQATAARSQKDRDLGRPRVTADVRQGLLRHAKDGVLRAGRQCD